jgi:hypothetical protein
MNGLHSVQTLFVGRRFEIPDYQRGYAWRETQWDDLLDDLDTLPTSKDHFTGMVVLKESEEPPVVDVEGVQYRRFDVVDGQQRLSTLIVLLESVRRSLATLGVTGLAEGIRRSYVSFVDRNGQPVYRLRLNDGSQAFFESVVLAEHPAPIGATTDSERRLLRAREHFMAAIRARGEELNDADQLRAWLEEFHDKVAHHLKLNLYTVEDAAEVGVIFEVMNNRGKQLSELDLVKNYVLYLGTKLDLPEHSLHSEVVQSWGGIFRNLMSASLTEAMHEDQLLRAHWLLAYDYQRRNWDGVRSIKGRLNLKGYLSDHQGLLIQLRRYVESLSHAAIAYCDIYSPTRPGSFADFADDLAGRLEVIRTSDALVRVNALAGFIPLLIATRLAHPADARLYAKVVRLCEALAFRVFRLKRWRSHTGQSTLFRLANQIYAGEVNGDLILASLRATLHSYSPEGEFAEAFRLDDEKPSDWYGWPGLRYFLYEYERHLCGKDDVWITWAEVEKGARERTIEHIFPQTPTGAWLSAFSEDDRTRLTHDIGNLTLTSDNSSLSNKQFAEKKGSPGQPAPCYANSQYAMERAVCQYDDWNAESLLRRRESIVAWALERWGVEGDHAVIELEADELDDDVDQIPAPVFEPGVS